MSALRSNALRNYLRNYYYKSKQQKVSKEKNRSSERINNAGSVGRVRRKGILKIFKKIVDNGRKWINM